MHHREKAKTSAILINSSTKSSFTSPTSGHLSSPLDCLPPASLPYGPASHPQSQIHSRSVVRSSRITLDLIRLKDKDLAAMTHGLSSTSLGIDDDEFGDQIDQHRVFNAFKGLELVVLNSWGFPFPPFPYFYFCFYYFYFNNNNNKHIFRYTGFFLY